MYSFTDSGRCRRRRTPGYCRTHWSTRFTRWFWTSRISGTWRTKRKLLFSSIPNVMVNLYLHNCTFLFLMKSDFLKVVWNVYPHQGQMGLTGARGAKGKRGVPGVAGSAGQAGPQGMSVSFIFKSSQTSSEANHDMYLWIRSNISNTYLMLTSKMKIYLL